MIQSLAVVGAGFMGRQIAARAASHGVPVTLIDSSEAVLESLRGLPVSLSADLACAASVDLVIEALPERVELKRDLFARLDAICEPQTIFSTNSSSIRSSELESAVQRRDRILNLHFFAPVKHKPMAEIMGATQTSAQIIAAVHEFVQRIGITPLIVRKQSTGFLFNRVWRAIKKECLQVVSTGVASVEDVDRAWMIFMNHRMGPFGQMDMIGLDVIRDIEMVYYRESGDPSDAPPALLVELVEQGHLGVKSGRGFYTYPNPAFEDPGFLGGHKI
jgi:3-hydroxybutyryl-CoA dehydrogenase